MVPLLLSAVFAAPLTLTSTPVVSEQPFQVTVEGLRPGESVLLGAGATAGPGPCPRSLAGACLGLIDPVPLAGATADLEGRATWTLTAPRLAHGRAVHLQAVAARSGGPVLSDVTTIEATWLATHGHRVIRGTLTDLTWTAAPDLDGLRLDVVHGGARLGALGTSVAGTHHRAVPVPSSLPLGALHLAADHPVVGAVESAPLQVAGLLAFHWDGQAQRMAWIDDLTGTLIDVGTVGDLASWSGEALVDPVRGTVYVIGSDDLHQVKLWELDLHTGDLLRDVLLPPMHLLGVQLLRSGELLGLAWDGQQQAVYRVDPATGDVTPLAAVDGLTHWAGETTYDPRADVVWAFGVDRTGAGRVWGVDPTTGGVIASSPVAGPTLLGARVDVDGTVLACRWTGVEELVRVDPWTGGVEVVGVVGDLASWSGQAVLDEVGRRLFVWGHDGQRSERWLLDVDTGTLLDERPADLGDALGVRLAY